MRRARESALREPSTARLRVRCSRVLLLLLSMVARSALAAAAAGNVQVEGRRPQLVFACDSDAAGLQSLFVDPGLIPGLKALRAEIALSLTELSPERAQLVGKLNDAGIATIAWLALPASEGYYRIERKAPAFQAWGYKRELEKPSSIPLDCVL